MAEKLLNRNSLLATVVQFLDTDIELVWLEFQFYISVQYDEKNHAFYLNSVHSLYSYKI